MEECSKQSHIQSTLIPTYKEIMDQKPEIMSFRDLKKEESYAVVSYRYVTLSANQGQVIVATLWSKDQFPWSKTKTQEVWSVKVLKDFLVGDLMRELPFWLAVSPEKTTGQGSYYPLKAMDFTEEQLSHFEWAQKARERVKSDEIQDRGKDDTMSVYSANTQLIQNHPPQLPQYQHPQFYQPQHDLRPAFTPNYADLKRPRLK